MKGVIQMLLLILFIFVGVPLVIGLAAWDTSGPYATEILENKVEVPKKIKVWNEDEQKTEKVNFEEYVACVVAGEMPSSFELEALKAQAVAARTYAMSKVFSYERVEPAEHPKAAICNTTHCQVYKPLADLLKSKGKEWEETQWQKIKDAVESTEGQLMYYGGEMVTQPLFFSSSGGQTENSEDVFQGEYPYLVSVSSPYEEGASHTDEKKEFSLKEVKALINDKYSDRDTGSLNVNNIKILSRTAGGRVDKIQLGQSTYKGTEVRSALGLSSTLFSISFEERGKASKIIFTSNGYGHGVGMSQYGANGMAKEGKTYEEIIAHYYTGVKVY